MTIKLEQETILRVCEHQSQLQQQQRRPLQDETPLGPLAPSSSDCHGISFNKRRKPLFPVEAVPSLTEEDDDTLSTASMSSDEDSFERRVSFCEDVVTEIWTRPFTEQEDIPTLYYSSEDTARFRQEYRLEKKLLSDLSVDPVSFSVDEDVPALVTPTSPVHNAYRISRVVVLHNDKLETFVDKAKETEFDEGFFDNDSFWSGSITWY